VLYTKCRECDEPNSRHGYCNEHMPRCHCGAQVYRRGGSECIRHDASAPQRYQRRNCRCGKTLRSNQRICVECKSKYPRPQLPKCKCGKRLTPGVAECAACKKAHIHIFRDRLRVLTVEQSVDGFAYRTGPLKSFKTECVNGHDYTPENTAYTRRGHRRCRTCARDQAKDYENRNPHRRTMVVRQMTGRGREIVAKARKPKGHTKFRLDSQQWRTIKREHKAYSKIHDLPCWYAAHGKCVLDGAPIDYDAPHSTPYAYETDHRKPRATHPHLMYVWSNLRASHCRCNRTHQHRADSVLAQQNWVRPKW
jgi:hypothetical protein